MTKDEIIEMARQAGFDTSKPNKVIVRHSNGSWVGVTDELEAFAKLVAAKEREACAKVCEHMAGLPSWEAYQHYLDSAKAIRARGKA